MIGLFTRWFPDPDAPEKSESEHSLSINNFWIMLWLLSAVFTVVVAIELGSARMRDRIAALLGETLLDFVRREHPGAFKLDRSVDADI
eukprot:4595177-Prymnesium_polylepis.1